MTAISIVIPTWNGLQLLQRFLPGVSEEAGRWSAEIVVADDGSTDATGAWLAQSYPAVRVAASPVNRGFAVAANAGVAAARAGIVVLLNNDVALEPGSLDALLPAFAAPEVFGVTFRSVDLPALTFGTGGKLARFRRGFWSTWRNYDVTPENAAPLHTFMLAGGFCAFRRAAFLEIGGFDPIFSPYYWEDVDLGYRARKRGWELRYEPRLRVQHLGSASTVRHRTPWKRAVVIERNKLLFHWRNLDRGPLLSHLLWSHLMLLQMAVRGRFAYHAGYLQALGRLPQARQFRRRERPFWRRRDRELAVEPPPGALDNPGAAASPHN